MIVCRPRENERQVLAIGQLDLDKGLIGDNWKARGSWHVPGAPADPLDQITLMNARVAAAVAGSQERWVLAGDQLYVDFDLSEESAPAGTQLQIGEAIIEITPPPHTGCKKFTQRFGLEAMKFVNSQLGKQLHLRGVNARVMQPGTIQTGDRVRKLS